MKMRGSLGQWKRAVGDILVMFLDLRVLTVRFLAVHKRVVVNQRELRIVVVNELGSWGGFCR